MWQYKMVATVTQVSYFNIATQTLPKRPTQTNISPTLVGNKIVDHSDVGAAPTTFSFPI